VNRLLNLGLEVLHTHRDAVEPARAQRGHVLVGRNPRIDFDRNLGALAHRKRVRHGSEQARHLIGREVGRRASAPVLLGGASRAAGLAHRGHLSLDGVEEAQREFGVGGDDPVARAEVAEAVAEGNVDVE
jgi:hypothetical protein